MALTLADADRAIAAAEQAGVPLQVGFNRRYDAGFRAAHDRITGGAIGTPQLLRSLTRDPAAPAGSTRPGCRRGRSSWRRSSTTSTRCATSTQAPKPSACTRSPTRWSGPISGISGLLDTSIVTIRFDNGAMATAEASFQATYGYDIRGEVFGSAGMVTAGDIRRGTMTCYGEAGLASDTWRRNIDLFHDAYIAELADFTACVRDKTTPAVTGQDARAALAIALAAIRSVQASAPVRLTDIETAEVRAPGMGH